MSGFNTLLTSFLDLSAANRASLNSLQDRDRTLTFAETRAAAVQIAWDLCGQGVGRGERVLLLLANSAAFCLGVWGVLYAGAVVVPLNPGTPVGKLRWILIDCAPKAVICDTAFAPVIRQTAVEAGIALVIIVHGTVEGFPSLAEDGNLCRPPPDRRVIDQDLAAILYTSGSTGTPKGVMLSHLNMTTAARSVAQYLDYRPEDRVFCVLPLTFDYGLHQLTMTTLVGATLILEPSFAQPLAALHRLTTSGATVFPVVPTMVPIIAALADRFDFSAVRLLSSTAAALHPDAIDTIRKIFPTARLFSMYGLTECHRCTYLDPSQLDIRKNSVGQAIPNTEMWVVDTDGHTHHRNATGELVIRGNTVMRGYWRNPEETAKKLRPGPIAGEWVLYTGDTCRIDEEGYLYFISRTDDILKVRGEKVVPMEVEAALAGHPTVAEVCVMGMDHPVYGQDCVAIVTGKKGQKADPHVLKTWCSSKLDPHAIPGRIVVVEAIPRTLNGKMDYQALRLMIEMTKSA